MSLSSDYPQTEESSVGRCGAAEQHAAIEGDVHRVQGHRRSFKINFKMAIFICFLDHYFLIMATNLAIATGEPPNDA